MHEATLPMKDAKNVMLSAQAAQAGVTLAGLDSAAPATDPKLSQPKKASIQYVPVALMEACAEALEEGRIKYGVHKWRETPTDVMTYVGGALRHLFAYVDGEDIDPDSKTGKRHLSGAVASLAILLDVIANGTAVDNRPPKGPGGKLMRPK